MYKCAKFGPLLTISRAVTILSRKNTLKCGSFLSLDAVGVQSHGTRSSVLGRGHARGELIGQTSHTAACQLQSARHSSSGGSKPPGGINMAAVAGIVGSVLVAGILYKSTGQLTDVTGTMPTAEPKSEDVSKSDDKASTDTDVATPVEEPLKFPEEVTYLIVGAGTAAMTATKTIRKNDPTAKVLMVTEEEYHPYMRPPLSKELWFQGSDPGNLSFNDWAGKPKNIFYQPKEFFLKPELLSKEENGGTALAYQKKVKKLDILKQTATFEDGDVIKYDKCLLATGGKPRNLPIFNKLTGEARKKVHLFRNVEDFRRLYSASDKAKSIMVVGGGFLGSELAVALAQKAKDKDLKISQAFPEKGNMGLVFPEYLSKWTLDKVSSEGVTVYPESFVVGCQLNKQSNLLELVFNSGEKVSADEVVVAVGLEPNVELAHSSGLELDNTHGGFLVNAELEARRNLWVAGDAACFYDISLGRRRVEHHDHAVVSGRLAGENMTGQGKPYWHQSMFWSDLGPSIGYEAIGICDSSLPTFAVFAKASEKDTPKAVVEETGEELRSESETEQEASVRATDVEVSHAPMEGENYGKGIIFYTRDDKIVGMVLWNLFGRMPIARQVLKEGKVGEDLAEVARLFDVHDQKKSQ